MGQCGNLGLGIGFLATIGILYCLGSRYWQVNSQVASPGVTNGVKSYQGLWVRCLSYVPGVFQCDNFDESYLGLPASLQCQRAFMVIAGICAVAGLVAGAMGLDCIHAIEGRQKTWSGRGGGILMILAGILTLAAVSWYAADVVREYWNDQYDRTEIQYQFGAALYMGWVSAGLALISGGLIVCSSCTDDYEDEYRYPQEQRKVQRGPARNEEYI